MNRADRRAMKFGHRTYRRRDAYGMEIKLSTNKGQTVITTERNKKIQVIDTVKNNGVIEE